MRYSPDKLIMEAADRLVLWLWDNLELERRVLVRVSLIGWLMLSWLQPLHDNGHLNLIDWVCLLAVLLILTLEEVSNSMRSPDEQNMRQLVLRHSPFTTFFRYYLHIYTWIGTPIFILTGTDTPLDIVRTIVAYAALILAYTFQPPNPPKRRQREEDAVPDGLWDAA